MKPLQPPRPQPNFTAAPETAHSAFTTVLGKKCHFSSNCLFHLPEICRGSACFYCFIFKAAAKLKIHHWALNQVIPGQEPINGPMMSLSSEPYSSDSF